MSGARSAGKAGQGAATKGDRDWLSEACVTLVQVPTRQALQNKE